MCFSVAQITKKLAGAAAGTAAWVTNVGNEYGQVLMSVLTAAEGDGLANMAAGLMRRYREAGKASLKVLYVDRDCCGGDVPRVARAGDQAGRVAPHATLREGCHH